MLLLFLPSFEQQKCFEKAIKCRFRTLTQQVETRAAGGSKAIAAAPASAAPAGVHQGFGLRARLDCLDSHHVMLETVAAVVIIGRRY